MSTFNIVAIVLVITAVFAVINDRFIKLHRTIGVMLISLLVSLFVLIAHWFNLFHDDWMTRLIHQADFSETLIQGMLGSLLFAGAIHIKSDDLRPRLIPIAVLATGGVVISTVVVGYLLYYALHFLSAIHMPLMYCFTFAALISPTDPIAVLAILRSIGVSRGLDMDVCGESLFNDGIGLVVFTFFFSLAVKSETMSVMEVTTFFLQNVGGALILGAVASYGVFCLMRSVSDYHIEILLSLALVFGTFQFAEWIDVSPAITTVIVGLVFGHLCYKSMSDKSRNAIYTFWEVIDEVLNTVLFVMVGIILLLVQFDAHRIILGVFAVVIVLFGRWVSVVIPVGIMRQWFYFSPRSVLILTWGGLRGGLSIAMALTLPEGAYKEYILLMTYAVVVFSIIIQGTTVARLASEPINYRNAYEDPSLNERLPPDNGA